MPSLTNFHLPKKKNIVTESNKLNESQQYIHSVLHYPVYLRSNISYQGHCHYLRSNAFIAGPADRLALLSVLAGVHHSAELDVVQLPVSRLVEMIKISIMPAKGHHSLL